MTPKLEPAGQRFSEVLTPVFPFSECCRATSVPGNILTSTDIPIDTAHAPKCRLSAKVDDMCAQQ
jgi:hypothetical protein